MSTTDFEKDGVPGVELHDGPTPGLGVTDPCPYCGERHVHGIEEDVLRSHRVPHCVDEEAREKNSLGYWVLRPIRTLFGYGLRWWEDSDVVPNLGMGEPGEGAGNGGDGLLGWRRSARGLRSLVDDSEGEL